MSQVEVCLLQQEQRGFLTHIRTLFPDFSAAQRCDTSTPRRKVQRAEVKVVLVSAQRSVRTQVTTEHCQCCLDLVPFTVCTQNIKAPFQYSGVFGVSY